MKIVLSNKLYALSDNKFYLMLAYFLLKAYFSFNYECYSIKSIVLTVGEHEPIVNRVSAASHESLEACVQ